jgi:hypothetical protein
LHTGARDVLGRLAQVVCGWGAIMVTKLAIDLSIGDVVVRGGQLHYVVAVARKVGGDDVTFGTVAAVACDATATYETVDADAIFEVQVQ